ncbi:NAD(P)H-dependent oxidoreductase [Shimia sagamensis]|uniref:Glutathione-regulated potassium-efflux system ancillary protein KefG n=1 Tax=Shimia sagamensis TaxID=1566352 RepID=A0ABY1NP49_9RHOB|nr:NAD(P)H-dependent oxidoreductase [Shimia sagamensis]SMP13970.1 glutathione-regulated potassium-efflux system ancillary protein KefG [Shimia sagamensis]
MNTLVLSAHPNLATSTANRTWFDALSNTAGVTPRDLASVGGAEMHFDAAQEQSFLQTADRIVLQFPFYWYSSPPVLKAWLDQVLLFGFAYGPGGTQLHGKELGLAITTGGPAASFQSGAFNNFSMAEFLVPFQQTARMVGMTYLPPFVLHSAMSRDHSALNASIPALISYVTAPRHAIAAKATRSAG